MPDIQGLMNDPDFKALPPERQKALLEEVSAHLVAMQETITAPATRGVIDRSNAALAQNLATIDPRLGPAATVDPRAAALAGATPLALPVAMAARAVAPGVGAALRFAATPKGGAVIGGVEGAQRGVGGAVEGAIQGAVGGTALNKAGKLLQLLGRFKKGKEAIAAAQELASTPAVKTTAQGAVEAIQKGLPLNQEELQIVTRLRGAMDTAAGRSAVKEVVKEQFPDNWAEVWKFLTSARTRM